MGILLLPAALLGIMVFLVFQSSRRLSRAGGGEESAHALALERRQSKCTERRRERRIAASHPAIASILGSDAAGANCRIVDASRSGMRISVSEPVCVGAQVNVAWDSEFFVGTVCYSTAQQGQYLIGLQVISTSRK